MLDSKGEEVIRCQGKALGLKRALGLPEALLRSTKQPQRT